MIYVLVKGMGSHDDYKQINVFASSNKETIEQKLKICNEKIENATKAFNELKLLREKLEKDDPAPEDPRYPKNGMQFSKIPRTGGETVYDEINQQYVHPLVLDYLTVYRKRHDKIYAIVNKKKEEFIEQYDLKDIWFSDYGREEVSYWMEEVDSD